MSCPLLPLWGQAFLIALCLHVIEAELLILLKGALVAFHLHLRIIFRGIHILQGQGQTPVPEYPTSPLPQALLTQFSKNSTVFVGSLVPMATLSANVCVYAHNLVSNPRPCMWHTSAMTCIPSSKHFYIWAL